MFLETFIEQHFAQEAEVRTTPLVVIAKSTSTPTELCFSLWVKGFVNAALSISIILSLWAMSVVAIILIMGESFKLDTGRPKSLREQFLINSVTLHMAVATFSLISTGVLAVLAVLRSVFIRFSIIGAIPALIGVIAYFSLSPVFISFVEKQDQSYRYGVISSFIVAMITVIIGVAGLRYNGPEENKKRKSKPRDKLTVRKFFSGQWTRDLHEEVKKIYRRNKEVEEDNKQSSSISHCIPRADITGDFKAWNDATKLLLTIATGLTVVAALFSNGNSLLEQAIRIIALLFLLVPGLSCAYMEAFRRQCERQWLIVDEMSKDGRAHD